MSLSRRTFSGGWAVALAVFSVVLVAAPGGLAGATPDVPGALGGSEPPASGPSATLAMLSAPRVAIPLSSLDSVVPGSTPIAGTSGGTLSIVVTLAYSNESRLDALLRTLAHSSVANASYLSAAEFSAEFSPSVRQYAAIVDYLSAFDVSRLTTYSDRATVSFDATPAVTDAIFGTSISTFALDGGRYVAPTHAPTWPAPIAGLVRQVEGLSTSPFENGAPLTGGNGISSEPALPAAGAIPSTGGYPSPVVRNGTQIEFAPDLQVAQDERTLFSTYGYPVNSTVALVTSAGTYTEAGTNSTRCGQVSSGQDVGGWDPADLASYFGSILPAGEPTPTVTGVPLAGATAPGCFASWDGTGAVVANTADLESIGATAPGARIYGVYGPTPSLVNLDAAFATVLNPGSSVSRSVAANLGNVSVIATQWGFRDQNDSSWYASLQQAAARGITVLAASGNSADNPASLGWLGSQAEFPASMATAALGNLAVGGATLTLNATTLRIEQSTAWNISTKVPAQGGPIGSAGGISAVFHEPNWQKTSSAASLLGGTGRGVPDLAGLANNSAVTVSRYGYRYLAANASLGGRFFNANGTGLATAADAGLFAEIDHALGAEANKLLGFAEPTIYTVGNLEYAALPSGLVHGAYYTSLYTSPLPALPFHDVASGRNFADRALAGYDLVTGWGVPDAYNLTIYVLAPPNLPASGPLRAVQDYVNLTALSIAPNHVGSAPVMSVQQNLFLADSLGAPIYWVQSVLYYYYTGNGHWAVNFTGWVTFPFWGIYPAETVYEYWYPTNGKNVTLPLDLVLTTFITADHPSWNSEVTFGFGDGVSQITLPVPGAAYILGGYDHAYSWQGSAYSNGPGPAGSVRGFLGPQLGFYGYPGSGVANFESGTAATVAAYVEPLGTTSFEAAQTSPLLSGANQTAEYSENLGYFAGSAANLWTLGYQSGSTEQGISIAEPYRYAATVNETGAPGGVGWTVTFSNGLKLKGTGATPSLVGGLENGSYGWTVSIASNNFTIAVASGNVTVDGGPVSIAITFIAKQNSVTFDALGAMTFPFPWHVTIDGGAPIGTTTASVGATLVYAKYSYHVFSDNSSWAPARSTGTFTIGPNPQTVDVTFDLVTYNAKIVPTTSSPVVVRWTVTIGTDSVRRWATSPYVVALPNGTYPFNISGLPAGDSAHPSSGTFQIDGKGAKVLIEIVVPSRSSGLFGLGVWGYVLVGGIAAAVVLIVAAVVIVRRRDAESESDEAPPEESPPDRPKRPRGPPPKRRSQIVGPDEI